MLNEEKSASGGEDQSNQAAPGTKPQQSSMPNQVSQQPDKSENTKWLLLILVGIVVAIVVIFGGYFFLNQGVRDETPSPTPTINPNETPTPISSQTPDNWETYINPLYTIKYPEGWTLKEEQLMNTIDPNQVTIYPPDYNADNYGQIYIRIMDNADSLSITQWIAQDRGNWCFGNSINRPGIESREVTVGGKNGLEIIIDENDFKCTPVKLILISTNNSMYELFTNAESDANKIVFDQVISTFKFAQ